MENAPDKKSIESVLRKRLDYSPTADLFPESLPPVAPAFWPTSGTRADEALQALIERPQNQADYWHGWRLAAYVKELKDLGWSFLTREITKPGCRRPIAEYELDRDAPGAAATLASFQKGILDPTLAGLVAFAAACALLMVRWPL